MSFPEPNTGSIYVPGPPEHLGHPSTWPTNPAPPPVSPPAPERKRRAPLIAGLAALGVLLAGGIAGGVWYAGRSQSTPGAAASPTPSWSSVTGANCPNGTLANGSCATVVNTYTPKPADFTLTLKILEKKCFGSAGCNVIFRIELTYGGQTLDSTKTYEVTYRIDGAEDPYVSTLTVTGDSYRTNDRDLLQTKTSKDELKVVVTDVSER